MPEIDHLTSVLHANGSRVNSSYQRGNTPAKAQAHGSPFWRPEYAAGRIVWPVRADGRRYSPSHAVHLWARAQAKSYDSSIWMTRRQARFLGGRVMKAEKGLLRWRLFNAEQVNGLHPSFYDPAIPVIDPIKRIKRAEKFFDIEDFSIHPSLLHACYWPEKDYIELPPFELFIDAGSYYSTLAHEVIHWTGHPNRLSRCFGCKRFGDAGYAMGELVAEIGSSIVLSRLKIREPINKGPSLRWIFAAGGIQAISTATPYARQAVDFISKLLAEKRLYD